MTSIHIYICIFVIFFFFFLEYKQFLIIHLGLSNEDVVKDKKIKGN